MKRQYITSKGLKIYRFPMLGIDSNMYVIIEGDEALVFDPNTNEEALELLIKSRVNSIRILLTHEHFDHISGVNSLRRNFRCFVMSSQAAALAIADASRNLAKFWEIMMMDKTPEKKAEGLLVKDENYVTSADETFDADTEMEWHGHQIKAVLAPGHSRGSVLYFLDDVLFAGDCLINGVGVICRLPGGNWKTFVEKTMPIFAVLPDDKYILTGHGEPGMLHDLKKYLVKYGSIS